MTGEAHAAVTVTENGGAVEAEWGAADVPTFQFGAAHACPDPLDNKVAFKLGNTNRLSWLLPRTPSAGLGQRSYRSTYH
jgi:hypothetical protein